MRNKIDEKIQENIEGLGRIARNYAEDIQFYERLRARLGENDLSEFEGDVTYLGRWGKIITISTIRESRLPHKLAQIFGRFEKIYDNGTMKLRHDEDDLMIEIDGYLPDSCKVETWEEQIPEEEIVRTRTKSKIICNEEKEIVNVSE